MLGADPDLDAIAWTSLRANLTCRGLLGGSALTIATLRGCAAARLRGQDAGKIDDALGGRVPVLCISNDQREYGVISPAAPVWGTLCARWSGLMPAFQIRRPDLRPRQ